MTHRRGTSAAILFALAPGRALAGDPAEAAQRARACVNRVFSEPEFSPLAEADRIPRLPEVDLNWLERIWKWLRDNVWEAFEAFLRWLFDEIEALLRGVGKLFGGGGEVSEGSGQAARILGWGLGVVALALVVWLVVRLLLASSAEKRARAAAITGAVPDSEDDALARTPEEWRRSAAALAGGGRRREAIRALYLSLLASLHAAGAIDYDRTRTNTAYVGDLRTDHPARRPFVSLTGRFDVSWYGGHEPTDVDVDTAVSETGTVLAAFRTEAARV